VPGELCIGGVGLARGYFNRPDLTAEKFIPNPFSGEPGARLYKTGDLTRYLPDGNIEFLARLDNQVKIRGYRIEPGEIEAALSQHPGVGEVVVLARGDLRIAKSRSQNLKSKIEDLRSADKRLVAYIVAAEQPAPTESELRAFLRQRLPQYMLPSAFVMLDALPLTPNGKVDRRALPDLESNRSNLEHCFVAPRTLVEEVLASIWTQVLDLQQVSIFDDFFELGGHSLLATRIISRLRDALKVELPLRALFEAPTVSGMAERVESALRVVQEPAPPLEAVSRSGQLPLSFAQRRLWFLDQLEPGSPTYNIPQALRINGALDIEVLHRAVAAIARLPIGIAQHQHGVGARHVVSGGKEATKVRPDAKQVEEMRGNHASPYFVRLLPIQQDERHLVVLLNLRQ